MKKKTGFSGEPKTKWRTEKKRPDRDMELLDEFYFIDQDRKQWDAKKGEIVDGASIPRFLWSLIGSPYTRDYRRASIVHDVAVRGLKDTLKRKKADKMFYEACREGGCSIFESWVLYMGVRIGSWTSGTANDDYDEFELLVRDSKKMSNNTNEIRNVFIEAVDKLRGYDDRTSFDEIDQLVDQLRDELVNHGLL